MIDRLKLAFGCDLRTLALVRIAIATLIIVDLFSRSRDMTAHYTDSGLLTRMDLLAIPGAWRSSLHLVSGSATVQALLFLLAGVIALALAVGYRTRLATFLSWALLTSVQWRNPAILQGGDILLRLLLFWGMFLPLGARFSVDSALDDRRDKEDNAYFSVATAALLIQCMSVYFFSALLKSDPVWIPDATAVSYALRIDHITTSFGVWFRPFSSLHGVLTYYVWYLELVGPVLIFVPVLFPWLRLALQVMFIIMHIGFLLCLKIGLFPFVSITSLLSFTPGWVWDKLEARARSPQRLGIQIYYDRDCGFCLKTCRLLRTFLLFEDTSILPAQDHREIHLIMQAHNSWVVRDYDGSHHVRWAALALLFRRSVLFAALGRIMQTKVSAGVGDRFYGWVANNRAPLGRMTAWVLPFRAQHHRLSLGAEAMVVLLAAMVFWGNLATLPGFPHRLPQLVRNIRATLSLGQLWDMFAPTPSRVDGWYVVRGHTLEGNAVDVLKHVEQEPDWLRPAHLADEYANYRWRKYLTRIVSPPHTVYLPPYARYLCRQWNRNTRAGHRLAKIEIYFNQERIELDDLPRPVKRILLHEGACPKDRPIEGHPEPNASDST